MMPPLKRVLKGLIMGLMMVMLLSPVLSQSCSTLQAMARKRAITKALKIDPATARKVFAECRVMLEEEGKHTVAGHGNEEGQKKEARAMEEPDEEKSMKESLGGRMVDLPQAGPVIQSYEPVFVKVAPGMVWVSFSGEWTRKSKAFAFEYVAKGSEEAKGAGVQRDQLWMRNPNGDRVIYEEVE